MLSFLYVEALFLYIFTLPLSYSRSLFLHVNLTLIVSALPHVFPIFLFFFLSTNPLFSL